jgi:hypothetical protein
MPASSRAVRARLRTQFRNRRVAIARAIDELARCQTALHAAAGAIAAGLHAQMIDGDGAHELLLTVYNRHALALAQLDRALHGKGGATC